MTAISATEEVTAAPENYPLLSTEAGRIGKYSFKEFSYKVEQFHGSPAPGVLIGGFMVEFARQRLAEGILYEAICETRVCLADAIQLLTPCTTGNGRVKIVDVGRFALTLYDKYTGLGFRSFLDPGKLKCWPEIRAWFLKLKTKAEQDGDLLREEIGAAGTAILGIQPVVVDLSVLVKNKLGPVQICPQCGEAFPASAGERCGGCSGELAYLKPVGRVLPAVAPFRAA